MTEHRTPFETASRITRHAFISEDLHQEFVRVLAMSMEHEPDITVIMTRVYYLMAGTVAREWLKPEFRPDPIQFVAIPLHTRVASRIKGRARRELAWIGRVARIVRTEVRDSIDFAAALLINR